MPKSRKEAEEIYQQMVDGAPAIEQEEEDEDMASGNGGTPKSLMAQEEELPNISDMQATLRKLFPELGDKIHNALMMARVAPDMFIPILRILVNSAIKRMNPRQPINVAEKATLFYVLTSIGLDGKGRIDTIELAGSVKEAEELEQLGKAMGAYG